MFKHAYWIGIGILALFSCSEQKETNENNIALANTIIVQYPETYQDSTEVSFYGETEVVDPFRWLEYEYSPSVNHWVKSQQSLSRKYFDSLPEKWLVEQRLKDLWSYERRGLPQKKGAYYYQFANEGLEEQDILYRSQSIEGPFEELFDPNTLSENGAVSIDQYHFREDGKLLALQLSSFGSEWKTIRVLDLSTGRLLPDVIEEVKFSNVAWYADGFFYSRFPSAQHYDRSIKNGFHQLYYHELGSSQDNDEVVFADRIFAYRNADAVTSIDERFLVLNLRESPDKNAVYFRSLSAGSAEFIPIYSSFEHDFEWVGGYGNKLLFRTTHEAERGRLIQVSTNKPSAEYWEEVIPEQKGVLRDVYLYGNKLVTHYLEEAKSKLYVYSLSGKLLYQVDLKPLGLGAVTRISGNPENNEAFLGYASFNFPERIYRLNLNNGVLEPYFRPKIDFEAADYEVQQVTYESYDGVPVSMFIIHRKGLRLSGDHPTLLLAVGGMEGDAVPRFNMTGLQLIPAILEHDGVCAVANIRGNTEKGDAWHKAGQLHKKQNSFDDFQAAAEYLIANKYTSAQKLAVYGSGNGGLVVGASLTQRPDLFRVSVPARGFFDMLRYDRFAAAWMWAQEYGESQKPEDFSYLYAYSPLHNVARNRYPATLIMTAEHDDRVVPAHAYKFTAALQALQVKTTSYPPVLIQIEEGAGQQGKTVSGRIAEGTKILNFILFNLDEAIVY